MTLELLTKFFAWFTLINYASLPPALLVGNKHEGNSAVLNSKQMSYNAFSA